ncbi:hypothetical protein A4R26_03365 [Niastella populi]|uniref:Uncharacterized protein n=1 Tax=Niastella populi TaxID=550983 RepID=A0A1V9FJP0_9BACT|nr:hypothetical protein A4R26_03365 [Niastella populi]
MSICDRFRLFTPSSNGLYFIENLLILRSFKNNPENSPRILTFAQFIPPKSRNNCGEHGAR